MVPVSRRPIATLALAVALATIFVEVDTARGESLSCVETRAEARYLGLGYDHVVIVKNGCDSTIACAISTDVNPEVYRVTVAPAQQTEVVTFRGSPARAFTPRIDCTRE